MLGTRSHRVAGPKTAHLKRGAPFWNSSFRILVKFHHYYRHVDDCQLFWWKIILPSAGELLFRYPRHSQTLLLSLFPLSTVLPSSQYHTEQFSDSRFPNLSKMWGDNVCQGMPKGRDRSLSHVPIIFISWHVDFRKHSRPGVTTDRIRLARVNVKESWPHLFRILSVLPSSGLPVRTAAAFMWSAAIQPRISSAFNHAVFLGVGWEHQRTLSLRGTPTDGMYLQYAARLPECTTAQD